MRFVSDLPAQRRNYLFASHSAEVGSFRVGSHHLSTALARMGHGCAHVATPLSAANLLRRDPARGVRQRFGAAVRPVRPDEDGRLSVVPLSILPVQVTHTWGRNLALGSIVPPLGPRLRRAGFPAYDVTLIDQPMFQGIWRRVPTRRVVYRPTDIYPDGSWHEAQNRVLARADAVVATSSAVLSALDLPRQIPTLVLENGVDYRRFAGDAGEEGHRSGAVYVGALDQRLDWQWLRGLAEAVPDVPITVAGPSRHVPDLPGNLRMVGPVEYDRVPALLRAGAVGLLPFTNSVLNSGRSPMKLYEYLAAGMHVVGSDFSASRMAGLPGVTLTQNVPEAAAALRRAVHEGGANVRGQQVAADEDWAGKAQILDEFLVALD
jgi:teichuronic acid biosynthesis glycosyltransferase TuaH